MKNRLIIAAVVIGVLASCTKESNSVESSSDNAVQFTSATIATRTTEIEESGSMVDAWESGDKIGITTSGMISTDYINKQYIATTEQSSAKSAFEAVDASNTILYPSSQDQDITFYSYYPYSGDFDEYVVIDISGQNGDLGSVDFMTATGTWTYRTDNSETSIALAFEHKLSKVVFDLTFNDEAQIKESGNTISATIGNVVKSKAYSVISGTEYDDSQADEQTDVAINASIVDPDGENEAKATITAILHPSDIKSMVTITLNEVDYMVNIEKSLESGMLYTYNVTMGREEAQITGNSTISEWAGGTPTNKYLEAGSDAYLPQLFWDGSVAETFNGVAYDVYANGATYEITDGSELALLGELVAAGNTMYGTTFTMTGNFTLSDRDWTPIMYTNNGYFLGTFDGGGYTISGLNIDHDNVQAGLFANIGSSGTIKNLTVNGSIISSQNNIGAIVGYNYFGKVENCYSDVTITTSEKTYNIGGIVGYNNSGTVENCYNYATVNTGESSYTGGIVGCSYNGTIIDCCNSGEVTAYSYVGGVVGHNTYSSIVENCYNIGKVKKSNYDKNDNLDYAYGGVVGYNQKSTVKNCYNIGDIEVLTSTSYAVGGVAGYNVESTVKNCYNRGSVKGGNQIGGIVGRNNSDSYIKSVYNTAEITGTSTGNYIDGIVTIAVGGVIGYNNANLIYGFAYYNSEKSEGTNSVDGYNNSDGTVTNSELFSDPSADIEDDLGVSNSLIYWLNLGSSDSSWESDDNGINDGFPILKSINY